MLLSSILNVFSLSTCLVPFSCLCGPNEASLPQHRHPVSTLTLVILSLGHLCLKTHLFNSFLHGLCIQLTCFPRTQIMKTIPLPLATSSLKGRKIYQKPQCTWVVSHINESTTTFSFCRLVVPAGTLLPV